GQPNAGPRERAARRDRVVHRRGSNMTTNAGKFFHRQEIIPPDGAYSAVWSGYVVLMDVGGKQIEFQATDGVRGINVPVTVTVKDGVAEVRTKGLHGGMA